MKTQSQLLLFLSFDEDGFLEEDDFFLDDDTLVDLGFRVGELGGVGAIAVP